MAIPSTHVQLSGVRRSHRRDDATGAPAGNRLPVSARCRIVLVTASEPAGEVGINSYQLEPLELIGIDSNLALYLARSPELRSVACWPSSRRAVSQW